MESEPRQIMHRDQRTRQRLTLLAALLAVSLLACPWSGIAQEYAEPLSNREVGVSIDRYIGSYRNSEPEASHGVLIERAILRPGDPYKPGPPGAILEFHKKFSLGTLTPGARTQAAQHDEREVLYIESGSGRVESGDEFWPLEPGYGVLIPPHKDHTLVNESKEPMTLLVLTDLLDPGETPGKTILVRNSADLPYAEPSAHWNYFAKLLFGPHDGLNPVSKVLIVDLFPMSIGAPHPHIPHWEEVWSKLPPDSSYAFLGSEVRKEDPNEGFLVPPNGKVVHSVINLTERPMSWFYFCHYTVKVEYPDWVYQVPSIPPQKIRR
jgi:mannose-6-phosphate isomerase-like protein (cupin superfamily)